MTYGDPRGRSRLCRHPHGRVNRIFALGIAALVVSYALRLVLMSTETWLCLADWLTTFV